LFGDAVTRQGAMERRLLNDLFTTRDYNKLERPVLNETEALTVDFGLTIQQIIDVVSTDLLTLSSKVNCVLFAILPSRVVTSDQEAPQSRKIAVDLLILQ